MNQFEMVAIIVVAVMIASVLRARYHRRGRDNEVVQQDSVETVRLRDEVKELKERIKVLERITVEKENTLAKQIDELRDR